MSLLRAVATVGGFTMISRITGFVRDVLIAAIVGAGPVADAFFVAFKLPNFFRRLTAEGSFTVAFVPLFAGKYEADGKEVALKFAEEVFSVMIAVLLAFLLAVELFMPWLITVMAPGFVATPERFDLAVELTRITFPYLPLISFVALFGGMLNSVDRFAAMASAPILLNAILIAAMVFAGGYLATPGHVLAWGVAAAGLAQFIWLSIACQRAGLSLGLRLPRLTPQVKELFRLMLPAMVGAGVVQINLLIDLILASTLPTGSVSFLYYADRINQLPLGVIGVAIGTALLPMLSRQVRAGDDMAAGNTQNRALEIALLLNLPAAAALAVIAGPVITILFERGAFDPAASAATSAALAAYAFGLPAFVIIKVFQPGFFARKDTKTPVKIAVVAVCLNLALNLILMRYFAHVGIAMATAISSWVNASLLGLFLYRRGYLRFDSRLLRRVPGMIAASAVMAAALWLAVTRFSGLFQANTATGIAAIVMLVLMGIAVYFALAFLLRAASLGDLKSKLRRGAPQNSDDSA